MAVLEGELGVARLQGQRREGETGTLGEDGRV